MVGAGGLGSAVGYYLAAAGIGKIGIIDDDFLDVSNLQRQILHSTDRIGKPKVESARQTLESLNPDVKVLTYQERLRENNILDLIKGYDFIVDCSDNFSTRFLINDACIKTGKPFFYGAVFCLEGQAMTVIPGAGPCYRCLYPEPPPLGAIPPSSEVGILGVVPGIIGLIQATEVLKFVIGQGDLLIGKLLTFNAMNMDFFKLNVKRSPQCSCCGEKNKNSKGRK